MFLPKVRDEKLSFWVVVGIRKNLHMCPYLIWILSQLDRGKKSSVADRYEVLSSGVSYRPSYLPVWLFNDARSQPRNQPNGTLCRQIFRT